MLEYEVLLLGLCLFAGAVLYTSVGHAGASAYLALMALFGVAPAVMRPTALTLNILVAAFVSFRYLKSGMFRWRLLWPFLVGAVPFAFLGGSIQLPGNFYRFTVGVILLFAALRLLWPSKQSDPSKPLDPPIWLAGLCGVAIGFLSGLTGTGGGIFLSPLLLFMGWSTTKTASGVAIVFILCNSIAGLLGNISMVGRLPPELPIYALATLLGAILGSTLGIRFDAGVLLKILGVVLVIAGLKLIGLY